MTKDQFKELWESENGGGITWGDIAKCAVECGICKSPKTRQIAEVGNKVLLSAGLAPYWDENE